MKRVLVTGGRGVLGSAVAEQLSRTGYTIRIMSRKPRPAGFSNSMEWAMADLTTGEGIANAVRDTDIIVHAATDSFGQVQAVDVEGTRRLMVAARNIGVAHVTFVSIVGIDRVEYQYHRAKLAAEAIVRESGLPWSILRATQFHELVDFLIGKLARYPIAIVPAGLLIQPVESGEVADALCRLVGDGPRGMLPDMGGPEVLSSKELVRAWLAARGQRRLQLPLWIPGKLMTSIRRGNLTCPNHRQGQVTWAKWLARRYAHGTAVPMPSTYAERIHA